MSVREDQPLFPGAVHNHSLCFNESELEYKCQAISSVYQKGWGKGGVEWCSIWPRCAAELLNCIWREGGGKDGNEKEMTQGCGRISSKYISMPSSSEHGRFGRASHTSEPGAASPPGKGSWQLALPAPQVTGSSSSSSWGSLLIHRIFYWDGLTVV